MTSQEKFTCTTEEYQCTSPGTRVLIAQGDLIREERKKINEHEIILGFLPGRWYYGTGPKLLAGLWGVEKSRHSRIGVVRIVT
jgi:hypothetical protein